MTDPFFLFSLGIRLVNLNATDPGFTDGDLEVDYWLLVAAQTSLMESRA